MNIAITICVDGLFAGCLFESTALDDTKTPCCHSSNSPFFGRRALSFCKAFVDIWRVIIVFSHGNKSRAGLRIC